MILIIDNFDSFVHNLARHVRQCCQVPVKVIRSDLVDATTFVKNEIQALIISPGPCTPKESGIALEWIRNDCHGIPMLGVCLGHQIIGEALGCQTVRSKDPRHGKASEVYHNEASPLFDGIPCPFNAGRYHSLVVDRETMPDCLRVTAWTSDQTVMAFENAKQLIFGVQFHPESVLTDHGYRLICNFLMAAGIDAQLPKLAECAL